MHAIEVKITYPHDFHKIYPLLKEFNSPFSIEEWRRIFSYQWAGAEDYVGFHLEHEGKVVGFMGLIFSCRNSLDRNYKFCNITSLIVKESYRSATLLLLRRLQSLENVVCTGLGPIKESYRLLTMLGFVAYEDCYRIIPTVNCLLAKKLEVSISESTALLEKIDPEKRRIVLDHNKLKCKSVLFDFDGSQCLLIYKVLRQKYGVISAKKVQILSISNVALFNENIPTILNFFMKQLGPFSAIYLDGRLFQKKKVFFSIVKKIAFPKICMNPFKDELDIDELYSEVVLL